MTKEIAIVGGGISGLSTALALEKLGIQSMVYERASSLNELGAGIWLQPNAVKVLSWLGLEKSIRSLGHTLERAQITDQNLQSFRSQGNQAFSVEENHKVISIHRARLQEGLCTALPKNMFHLGTEITNIEFSDQKVVLQSSHQSILSDVVIGADGIHSSLRNSVFPKSELRYSGQTCWRGISNMDLPESFKHMGTESWGKKVRFGFAQISEKEVYWFAVALSKPGLIDPVEDRKEMLLDMFADFHPLVHEMIRNTDQDKMIRNDISDLRRLPSWYKGNVLLIGDAAHATTPNMGQGAGQGIEDAYYLANILAKSEEIQKAFQQFESLRRKKVDYVVNNSWRFGQMAHNSFGRLFMKTLMKIMPEKSLKKQMDSLYDLPEVRF